MFISPLSPLPFSRAYLQRVQSHPREMGNAEIQEVENPPPEGNPLVGAESPPSALLICSLAEGFSASGWTIGAGLRETVTSGCVRGWG
jgi:hypothetical protein